MVQLHRALEHTFPRRVLVFYYNERGTGFLHQRGHGAHDISRTLGV